VEKHYGLKLVYDLSRVKNKNISNYEKPKINFNENNVLEIVQDVPIVSPNNTIVFLNPCDRMIVREGDEYDQQLVRKINEHRFGCKYKHASKMGSENSEDATTWSFLKTLTSLFKNTFIQSMLTQSSNNVNGKMDININDIEHSPEVYFWFGRTTEEKVPVPSELKKDEGYTEFDVVIKSTDKYLITIEAKLTGTISKRGRNQFIRNIDVGSLYAKYKNIPLSRYYPLVLCPKNDKKDQELAKYYRDSENLKNGLSHRINNGQNEEALSDEDIENIAGKVSWITWEGLIEIANQLG